MYVAELTAHQQRSMHTRLANGESTPDVAKDLAVPHANGMAMLLPQPTFARGTFVSP
jgi:hypothetical protein